MFYTKQHENKMLSLNSSHQILFALVRNLFIPNDSNEFSFLDITEKKWVEIRKIAISQGLSGVCLDSFDRLPNYNRPNSAILLPWIGSALAIERTYNVQLMALKHLINLMRDNEICVLLLKGYDLSKYYPVPSHRPCGDIDVYLMGDYEKGNNIIRQLGISIEHEDDKHCSFVFDGVVIENHKTLLAINQYAADITSEEQISKVKDNLIFQPEGYYTLRPLDNYIFLLRHIARHFGSEEGYNSRQLLDIVLFLSKNKRRIDKHKLGQCLKESRMLKMNDLFLSLGFRLFGIDLSEFIFNGVDERFLHLALLDMFETKDVKHREKDGVLAKCKELFAIRWKYSVLPESFFERLIMGLKNTIKQGF